MIERILFIWRLKVNADVTNKSSANTTNDVNPAGIFINLKTKIPKIKIIKTRTAGYLFKW